MMRSVVGLLFPIMLMACWASEERTPTGPVRTDQELNEPSEPAKTAPKGEAQIDGSVDGTPIAVTDARLFFGSLSQRDAKHQGVRVVLTPQSDICAHPDITHPSERALSFDIASQNGAIVAGAYTVPEPLAGNATSVYARLEGRTNNCATKSFIATRGAVTIDSVDEESGQIRGTFDLVLGGDRVTGTFNASPCDDAVSPALSLRCE